MLTAAGASRRRSGRGRQVVGIGFRAVGVDVVGRRIHLRPAVVTQCVHVVCVVLVRDFVVGGVGDGLVNMVTLISGGSSVHVAGICC